MISEKEYRLLCDLTDELLNVDHVSSERVAIPSLHVIRANAIFLTRYENIFKSSFKFLFFSNLKFIFHTITQLTKSLFFSKNYHRNEKTTFLFISHLINESHIGNEDDFYFGNLPQLLRDEGLNSAISLINHTPFDNKLVQKKWVNSKTPRITISGSVHILDEIKMLYKCFREYLKLKQESNKSQEFYFKNIALMAARDIFSQQTLLNLRIGNQIKRIVKDIQPNVIIATFEGHAWERVVFYNAKLAKPDIYCIGYQHAALFKNQYAIKRPIAKQVFNPDLILTSGLIGYEQLVNESLYSSTSFEILGSHKNITLNNKSVIEKEKNTCLVIPEGVAAECLILFEFSIKCAIKFPDIKFIWRVHPILKIDEIINNFKKFKSLPDNISISKASLKDDLKESNWALYRGTTAIVEAVLNDVKPIYFEMGTFNVDPLYLKINKLFYVQNVDDFSELILNPTNSLELNESFINLKKSLCDFYTPTNLSVLKKLVGTN